MQNPEDDHQSEELGQLLDTPDLADALGSDRFKQFLDHLPVAIAVSELRPNEHIVYGNLEFHRLMGSSTETINGKGWDTLPGSATSDGEAPLGKAISDDTDFLGTFAIPQPVDEPATVYAWSNIIEDDDGTPVFRLVALIPTIGSDEDERASLEERIREKDTLLSEIQHRVKNNLQMITALIRMEARHVSDVADEARFGRLAGRVEALALLYQALSKDNQIDEVDLGTYLSQIASAVMQAQAVEGIRLDLKVDAWPVSINVAMPAGLVVNELMTNALKYAFKGRDGGTIGLQSLVDDVGCRVVISDDGVGLPPDVEWPEPGKLSALIVRTLRENAHAQLSVESRPNRGTTVTIRFTRTAASAA
jgi:two-component sensor histidine kinase